MLQKIRI